MSLQKRKWARSIALSTRSVSFSLALARYHTHTRTHTSTHIHTHTLSLFLSFIHFTFIHIHFDCDRPTLHSRDLSLSNHFTCNHLLFPASFFSPLATLHSFLLISSKTLTFFFIFFFGFYALILKEVVALHLFDQLSLQFDRSAQTFTHLQVFLVCRNKKTKKNRQSRPKKMNHDISGQIHLQIGLLYIFKLKERKAKKKRKEKKRITIQNHWFVHFWSHPLSFLKRFRVPFWFAFSFWRRLYHFWPSSSSSSSCSICRYCFAIRRCRMLKMHSKCPARCALLF